MMQSYRKLIITGGVILAAILCVLMYRFSSNLEKENTVLKAQRNEILLVKRDYTDLTEKVKAVEGKKTITRAEGIVQSVDEVFRSLGLSQKVKSLKSTGTREHEFGIEEEAELQAERITMNEMVNIFYRIEHAPAILSVKKASMKTVFDNPSLLNITVTIGFIKPK